MLIVRWSGGTEERAAALLCGTRSLSARGRLVGKTQEHVKSRRPPARRRVPPAHPATARSPGAARSLPSRDGGLGLDEGGLAEGGVVFEDAAESDEHVLAEEGGAL